MAADLSLDKIGQIHITVDDLERTVAYYRDVLGMNLLFQVPEQGMAFFDCGGIRLYLGRAESPEFRSNPLLYYAVDSIQEAAEALEQRGVEFVEKPHAVHRTETSELWMGFFKDPESNTLAIMSDQPLAAAESA